MKLQSQSRLVVTLHNQVEKVRLLVLPSPLSMLFFGILLANLVNQHWEGRVARSVPTIMWLRLLVNWVRKSNWIVVNLATKSSEIERSIAFDCQEFLSSVAFHYRTQSLEHGLWSQIYDLRCWFKDATFTFFLPSDTNVRKVWFNYTTRYDYWKLYGLHTNVNLRIHIYI